MKDFSERIDDISDIVYNNFKAGKDGRISAGTEINKLGRINKSVSEFSNMVRTLISEWDENDYNEKEASEIYAAKLHELMLKCHSK